MSKDERVAATYDELTSFLNGIQGLIDKNDGLMAMTYVHACAFLYAKIEDNLKKECSREQLSELFLKIVDKYKKIAKENNVLKLKEFQ